VLFGNRRGSEDIGVPYMAHIEPVSKW
jgi:hypothetical protein